MFKDVLLEILRVGALVSTWLQLKGLRICQMSNLEVRKYCLRAVLTEPVSLGKHKSKIFVGPPTLTNSQYHELQWYIVSFCRVDL